MCHFAAKICHLAGAIRPPCRAKVSPCAAELSLCGPQECLLAPAAPDLRDLRAWRARQHCGEDRENRACSKAWTLSESAGNLAGFGGVGKGLEACCCHLGVAETGHDKTGSFRSAAPIRLHQMAFTDHSPSFDLEQVNVQARPKLPLGLDKAAGRQRAKGTR